MELQENRSLEGIRTYQEFKAATDREVYNQAEGFVRLGYLLRRAEDTDILLESGYKTVTEFAKAEYALTETYVSRYININRRYSEGGYSDRLMDRFRGFGMAKLADMLTLPDEVVEVIPQETTRAEIQEIKREVAQEQQVSDLEVLMESSNGAGDILTEMLMEYYRDIDRIGEYRAMHAALREPGEERRTRQLYNAIAPAGNAVKMARVPGTGRMMMTVRGEDQKIELLNVRSGEHNYYTWNELHQRLAELFPDTEAEKSWEMVYQEGFPQNQQNESRETKKKASVVSIAKSEIEPAAPKMPPEKTSQEKGKTEGPAGKKPEESHETFVEPEQTEEHGIAPVQENKLEQGHRKKTPEKDTSRQQVIEELKKEALERTEAIQMALEKGYYSMARSSAKKLFGILDAIVGELDKKGVPGQMEIDDVICQKDQEVTASGPG